jgi:ABC-type transport system involved in cytochrome c biogenesis permease component
MTVLPIVERELRVTARRRQTFWIRVALVIGALAIGGWVMLVASRFSTPQSVGQTVFVALSGLVFFYALLAGLWATADCLSEEKRAGTLGLLFLTDLKGYDIVLGKLAATSLHALSGLLAVLPVMAIPLLLGSVAGAEVARVGLVSLNTLFISLSAGLFSSAVCRHERAAVGLAFGLLATLTVGLPLLGALIADRLGQREPHLAFLLLSPGFTCILAFQAQIGAMSAAQADFVASVALVHGLGWLFLVSACLLAPRTWQERTAGARPARWRRWWRDLVQGSPERRRRFRARLLGENAFYWLAARDRSRPAMLWLFLFVSALLWGWGWAAYPDDWLDEPTFVFTGLVVNTILKCWLASEAAWRFSHDRQSGALELVLATPLRVTEIVRGQLAALLRQFGGPVLLVVGVEILFLGAGRGDEWVVVWVAGVGMLVADLVTLSWVGMWLGLNSRHHSRAMAAALALVCVLPWVLFGLFGTLYGLTRFMRTSSLDENHFTLIWLGLGLIVDVLLLTWARQSLLVRFRRVVTERFAPGRGRG